MPKSVLVISTLDTKGLETLYLKDKLSAIGLAPILMDISGRGSDIAEIDIPAARVAESGGGSFEEMVEFLKGKKLAMYKLPERLEVVDEFPAVGDSGKVNKETLKKDIAEKVAKEA